LKIGLNVIISLASFFTRAAAGAMTRPFEMGRAEIRRAEEEGMKMRKEIVPIRIKASRSSTERIGLLRAAIKKFDQDYTLEELGEGEVVKIMQEAKNFEAHKLFWRTFPHLAGKMAGAKTKEEEAEEKAIKTAIENITHHPEEQGQYVSLTSLKDERAGDTILENIANYFDGRFLSGLAREGGREGVDMLQKKFEEKGLDWFLKNNPKIPLWLATNPAQELGFESFGGMGRDEVRKVVYQAREKEIKRGVEKLWLPGMEGLTEEEKRRRIRETVSI